MKLSLALLGFTLGFNQFAFSMDCYDTNRVAKLANNNQQVLTWLKGTNTDWHRAYITGVVVLRKPDQTGHSHYVIDLDGDGKGDVEVIYQNDFGDIPSINQGNTITACGDFKVDHQNFSSGGFVHWVHCNPRNKEPNHANGFVAVNGVTYGVNAPAGEPACKMPNF